MANGICVFAEHYNGNVETVVAELVSAAHFIQETTKEKISAVVVSHDCDGIIAQLKGLDLDEVYAVKTDKDYAFQDDAISQVVADMIRTIDPSSVLVPATITGRSIFSRVAAKLGCGLTADCTELLVGTKEDGSYYIKQNKPSFGENVFVTIVTKDNVYPQMMTVRPGVYQPFEGTEDKAPLKIKSKFPYFAIAFASGFAVAIVSAPPRQRSESSTLSSHPSAIASRNAFSASGGPIVNTTTLPSVCSFNTIAASIAFRSAGLIIPSELARTRACVSGSTDTSFETGTCLIRTAISIFFSNLTQFTFSGILIFQ